MKTVLGLFTDRNDAEEAIDELKDHGLDPQDISIIMKDAEEAKLVQENTGSKVGTGAVSGVTTGAAVGGLAGFLIGIGALAIPGLGGLLIGGPLVTALGLTGAAAATAEGAMTGALAGGLIGGLVGLGLPEEDAREYERRINEGAILIAVPASADEEDDVISIMDDNNADDVKTIQLSTNI